MISLAISIIGFIVFAYACFAFLLALPWLILAAAIVAAIAGAIFALLQVVDVDTLLIAAFWIVEVGFFGSCAFLIIRNKIAKRKAIAPAIARVRIEPTF